MAAICLSTLNARYAHASLGLRYLAANLGDLRSDVKIAEFVLGARPADMVEALLKEQPRIVGFGVYIWNVEATTKVVAMLKRVAPDVAVVIGGPEVSYELEDQRIARLADNVITGPGEHSFAKLCAQLLAGKRPFQKIIPGEQAPLDTLTLPYELYTDEDIAKRFLYVEGSRGCPFKCEFCLSALDKTAWPFELERFLAEMAKLHERGARHFRFVDRTFNLNLKTSLAILEFFLARMDERLFVHFEVVPDHLPDKLKQAIARFPRGSIQFEFGIQSWNPEVLALLSRRQDNEKAERNLRWLREHSSAIVHADLIAGLPDEDLKSFERGFDRLYALGPHEIQVGILKRLRGTPIARHSEAHAMRYNPDPPYNVLATDRIDFATMQRLSRFARYWEMLGNSGRFRRTLPMLLRDSPFAQFLRFSDWLFEATRKTHEISLERLAEFVYRYLTEQAGIERGAIAEALAADYSASGARGALPFIDRKTTPNGRSAASAHRSRIRQARHLIA